MSQVAGVGNPSATPVFVVGMPRSGTTLAEQIIASHPAAFGADVGVLEGRVAGGGRDAEP